MHNYLESFRLTQPQSRIWYTQKIYEHSPMFNIGGTITIKSKINLPLLEQTILYFLRVHDVFRLRIVDKGDASQQSFCGDIESKLEYFDFSSAQNQTEAFSIWATRRFRKPMDVYKKLYDFALYKIDERAYGYFVKLHHLISDGWSIQLMTNQICELYLKLSKGDIDTASLFAYPYLALLATEDKYKASANYARDGSYWQERLTGFCGQQNISSECLDGKRETFYLSANLTQQIKKYCHHIAISENAFFVGLFLLYSYKVFGNQDQIVGIPLLGRTGRQQRATIGMFVSAMLFRFQADPQYSVREWFTAVSENMKRDFMHQRYPYNALVKQISRGARQNLYDVCINYYGTQLPNKLFDLPIENQELYNGQQEYRLQMIIREWQESNAFQLDFDYQTAQYTSQDIHRMFALIECLAEKIGSNDSCKISMLNLMSASEENELIYAFNQTDDALGSTRTVLDLFTGHAVNYPDLPAVWFEGKCLTYGQLDKKSNGFAQFIQSLNLKPGTSIAFICTYDENLLTYLLGILKAGHSYIPISPDTPTARIEKIIDTAGAVVFTNMESIACSVESAICISGALCPISNVCPPLPSPCDIAYLIFTSGSTGSPKGVMISHGNLANYITWAAKSYLQNNTRNIFALYSSLAFDLTVTSLFAPLASGNQVVIYRGNASEHVLRQIVLENRCNIIKLTPAHVELIIDIVEKNHSIDALIVGGENLTCALAHRINQAFGRQVNIYNEYGPTEATVGCMICTFDPKVHKTGSVPIGKPIQHTSIYILDADGQPVPRFVVGELYVAGKSVSCGYLNDVELTKSVFLNHPFAPIGLMYKTGDLAYFNSFGQVVYAGRKDNQVKRQGYRMELGEIESIFSMVAKVSQCRAKLFYQQDKDTLCMFYVNSPVEDAEQFERQMREHLPFYMVPDQYIKLSAMPLTQNGKVNDTALHLPDTQLNKPFSEKQDVLLNCLKSLLDTDEINIDSNFFQLGGDSIKAIQLVAKIREFGYQISVHEILANPFIKDMAHILRADVAQQTDQEPCYGEVKLTDTYLWYSRLPKFTRDRFVQSVSLRMKNKINIQTLKRLLQYLVNHHDALRLRYQADKMRLWIYSDIELQLEEYDVSNLSSKETDVQTQMQAWQQQLRFCMDESKQTICGAIFHTDNEDYLWIAFHHICIDAVSWIIILDNINQLISQISKGASLVLPKKTASFQQWASTRGIDASAVFGDIQQTDNDTMHLDATSRYTGELTVEETQRLTGQINNLYHTKPVELLLTAFIRAVATPQVYMDIEFHGRDSELFDLTQTVGWFTKIVTLAFALGSADTLPEHILLVKELYRKQAYKSAGHDTKPEHPIFQPAAETIQFNFLGEFQEDYTNFSLMSPLAQLFDGVKAFEVDMVIFNDKLQWIFRVKEGSTLVKQAKMINCRFQQELQNLLKMLEQNNEIRYSPSDFDLVNLKQDDIDALFK